MERLHYREFNLATRKSVLGRLLHTVFSLHTKVHRQRLALLLIQSNSSQRCQQHLDGVSRVYQSAGTLGLFSNSPEQLICNNSLSLM